MTQTVKATPSASDIRHSARGVLDGEGGQRLTLVLAVIAVLTAGVSAYALGSATYAVGFLLAGDSLWLNLAAYGVVGLLGILGVLPLMMGAYRLACLAYPPRDNGVVLPRTAVSPSMGELLYPFTTLRAYGRSLALGLELLGWCILVAVIPTAGEWGLTVVLDYLTVAGYMPEVWFEPLVSLGGLGFSSFGLLMLFLSGYRAGFAYLAFVHDPLPLGEVNRYFKGFRRSFFRPLALRLSLLGWVVLSILAVLVPFVAHTIPYGMCCSAVYGGELERK